MRWLVVAVCALAALASGCGTSPTRPKPKLVVEQARLIYPVDHGAFAIVLVRNRSGKTAENVEGRVSIVDQQGRRVDFFETDPVTLVPHSEAAWLRGEDLPRPLRRVKLHVRLAVSGFRAGRSSPVSVSRVRYRLARPNEYGDCIFSGVLSNRFRESRENFQLPIIGFVGSKLATGGVAYLDTVLPLRDAPFEVTITSPALCPPWLSRIEVLPNLSDSDIPYR
jgi:hypothetical protein